MIWCLKGIYWISCWIYTLWLTLNAQANLKIYTLWPAWVTPPFQSLGQWLGCKAGYLRLSRSLLGKSSKSGRQRTRSSQQSHLSSFCTLLLSQKWHRDNSFGHKGGNRFSCCRRDIHQYLCKTRIGHRLNLRRFRPYSTRSNSFRRWKSLCSRSIRAEYHGRGSKGNRIETSSMYLYIKCNAVNWGKRLYWPRIFHKLQ